MIDALFQIQGGYALVVLTQNILIGARDPFGIRPLVIGKLKNSYVLASETCALDIIGAKFIREVENGEIVLIENDKLKSIKPFPPKKIRPCVFEYIYFARPDSILNNKTAYEHRKNLGAELIEVEAVPYSNPKNYIKQSKKIAEDLNKTSHNGVYWANQFDNIINTEAHIETTAEEIWNQTAGTINGFTCAVGTGGTLAGVSIGLKNKNKDIKIALSDPMGSSLYSHIKNNKLESKGSSITEGIGSSRITANFAEAKIDGAFSITDNESLPVLYDLIQNEGLSLGTSCGVNIAGAIKLGKELGPGKTIVTILCDKSDKYNSKLFNKKFLEEKGLPYPNWI